MDYFGARLKSEKAQNALFKLENLYENTHQIMESLLTFMQEKKKTMLEEDDEEDYLVDPISFVIFLLLRNSSKRQLSSPLEWPTKKKAWRDIMKKMELVIQ